jgi:hypothetical protein
MMTCGRLWISVVSGFIQSPQRSVELVSPYPTYTAFQLNMRRKAEILKYDGNRQASKTNNFTRKENWSKIVRGTSSIQTTNYNIDNDLVNSSCMVNNATPMLTTRSNVPGKPIFCITTQRFRFTTTEIKCLTELMRPKLFRKPHCGILLQNSILNF